MKSPRRSRTGPPRRGFVSQHQNRDARVFAIHSRLIFGAANGSALTGFERYISAVSIKFDPRIKRAFDLGMTSVRGVLRPPSH